MEVKTATNEIEDVEVDTAIRGPKMNTGLSQPQELRVAGCQGDPAPALPPIYKNHRKILDVGCGGGKTLIGSALDPSAMAVGVDRDYSSLLSGKQLTRQINFVCAKGEALPLSGERFDLVICRVALPYMHNRSAIAEMWRVLRKGGGLWMMLHPISMPANNMVRRLSRLELKAAAHSGYVLINGLTAHFFGKELRWPFGRRGYSSFQTSKSITRALKEVGFVGIEIERREFFVVSAIKPDQALNDRKNGSRP